MYLILEGNLSKMSFLSEAQNSLALSSALCLGATVNIKITHRKHRNAKTGSN